MKFNTNTRWFFVCTWVALSFGMGWLANAGKNKQRHNHQENGHSHHHHLVHTYNLLRKNLAADHFAHARQSAKQLENHIKAGIRSMTKKNQIYWKKMLQAARELTQRKKIIKARLAFGDLSKAMIAYLYNNPKHAHGVKAYHCPMAPGYKKWVQWRGKMANPYMGKKMLSCGNKTKLIP